MYNIIAAIFDVESEGYQAMTTLSKTPIIEETSILQMALVKRENGAIKVCDSYDSGIHTTDDMLLGGLLGGLIGILGGPLGVLLMGSYGALAGSLLDAGDALDSATVIEKVAEKLVDGEVALIATVDEENEDVLDGKLNAFKVVIARFDAAVVAKEVEQAAQAEKEMQRLARVELREAKKKELKAKEEADEAKFNADLKAEIEELKETFKDKRNYTPD
jgi:uncharacterized membrane protein